MLSHAPKKYLTAALLSLIAILALTPLLPAADGKIFAEKPVIAPAQVAQAPIPAPAEAPKPGPDLFAKGPTPSWIWGADINRRYFLRKEFQGGTTAARLKATCDNVMTITLNGQPVAHSSEWQQPLEVDVQKSVRPGTNVLVAEVVNEGGAAGFVLKLALTPVKGATRYVVSDETWQAAEKPDAKQWVAAQKIAKLGDAPWNDVFAGAAGSPAVPSGQFQVLPGFQVERLFTVPREQLGSWVSLTFDDQGRLIASDQEGKGLCRITPPRLGSDEETRVEHLDVKITSAQGMVWAFGSLYLSVNGGPGSGLYRVRASKGDGHLDQVEKLQSIRGGGEHGPHGIILAPDGKSLYYVCGNHTDLPDKLDASRIPTNWAEDLILPRQWDANGHARGRMAPGGWIAQTDPDGKACRIFSVGYRNTYRTAFNADGELFAYDSDMEWDMGMPWYRPTRATHATSGSEFGWRSGSGKWPPYYVDSLPPLFDIGPGSPVGVTFGYGTKFPAKYQKALYLLDWTFGTIYALHLEPDGSTYRAVKEEFLSRTPLPLTDAAVGPDGALYFISGGRGTQSELFRVTYVGKEPTAPVDYHEPRGAEARALRNRLEAYHHPADDPAKAVAFIYPHLGHADRFIRYAARVALEHQKPALWQDRVLAETGAETLITGAVALARQGDKALQPRLLAALDRLEFGALPEPQELELLRAYQLAFLRMGQPDAEATARLAKKFDALYPARTDPLNRELCNLLVYLKAPTVISKTIALMQQESKPPSPEAMSELLARNRGYGDTIARMLANAPDLQKLHYAFVLRNLRDGWTIDQRKVYIRWLNEARQKSGGASYQGFINNTENEALDNATEAERLAIEAAGLRKPIQTATLPKPKGPGRDWKLADLVRFAEPRLKGRNFQNGQKMYAAARCIVCHRFNGEGGATGPDLTQVAGRFSLKDLGESIVEPSKVIADQYRGSVITTTSGRTYAGRIISDTKGTLTVLTDPEDPTKIVELKKTDVDEVTPSPISLMPDNLLKPLNDDEVLDLLAYLLSRGDPHHAMFRR
jgi:putative heme-binding domain-containing protein